MGGQRKDMREAIRGEPRKEGAGASARGCSQ